MYKNDPPGRTIYDCGSITYDYPGGIKMSFTQNVFHPRGLPAGGQYVYVYGTKGAVDLMPKPTMYPLGQQGKLVELTERADESQPTHIVGFYASIVNGDKPPADIVIGATAALTSILGHEAMAKQKVVQWGDLGVDV